LGPTFAIISSPLGAWANIPCRYRSMYAFEYATSFSDLVDGGGCPKTTGLFLRGDETRERVCIGANTCCLSAVVKDGGYDAL
jgi:hypothetical protein